MSRRTALSFIPRDELRQLLVDESVEVKVVHPEYVAENTVVIRYVRFHGYVGEEEMEVEVASSPLAPCGDIAETKVASGS